MSTTLSDLVKRKMEQDHLSLRAAGAQAGVAHTTIDRVIKDESVDLATLEKVCDWLGVPVMSVLDIENDEDETLEQIAAALALCPELSDVFTEIAERALAGEIDQAILREVAAFASYRLGLQKQQEQSHANIKSRTHQSVSSEDLHAKN